VNNRKPTKFLKRVQIVVVTQEYENKEDSHGGPGYYPREFILSRLESNIPYEELPRELKVNER